jgi:hypothetical protein
MTINKSLISIAAATLLAASFVGCSSDSSSTAATTTTTTPTTLTVTDGYVVNFTATATVSDGNDSNRSYATIALPNATSDASITAGSAQVAGKSTVDLTQDLTAAQIANLVSINIAAKPEATNGAKLTYTTFFDANSDGKFVTTDGDSTTATTLAMSAPVGYKNVTPITTLVQSRIATLTASDTNDTNRSEVIALALTQVAAGLGLTADIIKNTDPIDAVTSNPTYTLINSMLGQAVTDGSANMTAIATSLATATAATDAVTALRNIAAGATVGAAFYTSAATQLAADPDIINSVASMNLDGMRSKTAGGATVFTPTFLTPSSADFNVTSITIGNAASATLTGSGAKVGVLGLDDTTLLITKADVNTSNKSFTLAIKIGAQEARINDDANISSLVITVPFDVNNTKTTGIQGAVSGDVKWEGITPAGAFFSGDMNKTTFVSKVATALTVTHLSTTTGSIDFDISAIITAIDTNSSNAAAIETGQISNFLMALVDSNSALQQTNAASTASTYWGNTQVAATSGTINVTGKSLLKNSLLDGRANAANSTANLAPQNTLTTTTTSVLEGTGLTGTVGSATDPYVLLNNTLLTFTPGASVTDPTETNTSMTITAAGDAAASIDLNLTAFIQGIKDTASANVAGAASTTGNDVNFTAANLIQAGDVNATITTVTTDEFNEANTTVYYYMLDRPAYYNTAAAFTTASGGNTTMLIKDYDTNATMSTITAVSMRIVDARGLQYYISALSTPLTDVNLTNGQQISTLSHADANFSIQFHSNGYLELNKTLSTSMDYNFTITDINITDVHGADLNRTEAVDGNITF